MKERRPEKPKSELTYKHLGAPVKALGFTLVLGIHS